jgi:hypothetical protein
MNLNPATVLGPVFHFLDGMLEEYGVSLTAVRLAGPADNWLVSERRFATETAAGKPHHSHSGVIIMTQLQV